MTPMKDPLLGLKSQENKLKMGLLNSISYELAGRIAQMETDLLHRSANLFAIVIGVDKK